MVTKSSPSIYEYLSSILLSEGILDLFDVTHVEEEHTGKLAKPRLKKTEREFKKKKAGRTKARAYYRKKHPRKRGEKRGRPRMRSNEKFKPSTLSNGDTKENCLPVQDTYCQRAGISGVRVKRKEPSQGETQRMVQGSILKHYQGNNLGQRLYKV